MRVRLTVSPVDDTLCREIRQFIADHTSLQDVVIKELSTGGWGECEIGGETTLTEIGELYHLLQGAYPGLFVQVEPAEEHIGWAWLPENQHNQT